MILPKTFSELASRQYSGGYGYYGSPRRRLYSGAIAGIVVGCVVFFLILFVLCCMFTRRRRNRTRQAQGYTNTSNTSGGRFTLFGGGKHSTSQQPMMQTGNYPQGQGGYGGYGYGQQAPGVNPPQAVYR
ncbi:hypothetical protein BKA67DRAFT_534969 [Truncatella angustata]|uniref:Uncharacterized protein n=1 Tax=Truncatella angustata TaxID=152316 RepID=A0A9P8UPW7_9PEZI|nr:uncharacterized protein BKA67DRAFT_534969 [Truncatella angustata]KAH6656068.1 hypothetical protein BKA67DRAFT_534969 [Truncatella angustata]